jgi:hypothetical protein
VDIYRWNNFRVASTRFRGCLIRLLKVQGIGRDSGSKSVNVIKMKYPADLICLQKSLVSYTNSFLL